MYKKVTLEQLTKMKTQFFNNISSCMKKERLPLFKKFLKNSCSGGTSVIYFNRTTPVLHIIMQWPDQYILRDNKEKLELDLNKEVITKINSLLKNERRLEKRMKNNKAIQDELREEFLAWEHRTINDKPYLVYDIETTYGTNNLKDFKFLIAYMIDTSSDNPQFKHVGVPDAERFFTYLLEFDGYIIGYNHIWFDNPVMGYNVGATEEQIQLINDKSIDPFLFLQHTLKKRVWLNAIANAFVGITKTLESGTEAEKLYKQREATGEEKYMKELKKYCRNDVKMTILVFIYFIKYQKFWRQGEEKEFSLEDFTIYGQQKKKTQTDSNTATQQSMFV